jgi:isoleucyl-tRNA synthetase
MRSAANGWTPEDAKRLRDEQGDGIYFRNAEVLPLDFTPYPHNDHYELDYHRPYIDAIELVDTDGTKLVRVPDVFDCWFESGAMPYAETHYPFANREVADPAAGVRFPADFIAESVDQTRGWFYSLMVLGVGLFGQSPYKHVITNGLVLAEDGKKMSKKLRNYPDPMELADRVGADAIRYYLLSSPIIRGEDLNFSEKEVLEQQRKNIGRLHNVLAMYKLYADGMSARSDSRHVLDRWIIARLNQLVAESEAGYKAYELDRATRPIADFIDDLSVWYLRRSRDRFKSDDQLEKIRALSTLRYVLKTLALVMAPVMPFYAEYLWQRVRDDSYEDPESVHLAAWPLGGEIDQQVVADMANTRDIVTLALDLRIKANQKVRQPLNLLKVKFSEGNQNYYFISDSNLSDCLTVIRDELNVRTVLVDNDIASAIELDTVLTPELIAEGVVREFIRGVQERRKTVETTPDGQALLTSPSFREQIVKTVNASELQLAPTAGERISAGVHTFTVSLQKVN